MILIKKINLARIFVIPLIVFGLPGLHAVHAQKPAALKPRLVVLTDIAPVNVEPDDQQSMVRLLSYADRFDIEALVVASGWNSSERTLPASWMGILKLTLDAYEKDLPNLMKRSGQQGFLSLPGEAKPQKLGYWPSAAYLRSLSMFGSLNQGMKEIGDGNNSAGSDFIIKLVDEEDDRPLWISVWGGANTLAQAIWRVKKERTPEQLKTFLHKLRVYTILDQDVPFQRRNSDYAFSSHQWLRKEFAKDLFFLWDECAVSYITSHGKANWAGYKKNIQGQGNLGSVYPDVLWGVEGDTPSFLYVMPNGLSNPEIPGQANWGGYFEWMLTADSTTWCFANKKKSAAFDSCTKWVSYFYPAYFNDFAARMAWAKNGAGNRNPIVKINGDSSLNVLTIKYPQGTIVKLDASRSYDPDGNKLNYKWWIFPGAGSYKEDIPIINTDSKSAVIKVPPGSAGKNFHVICEVTDDGVPALTSYRRIIIEAQK